MKNDSAVDEHRWRQLQQLPSAMEETMYVYLLWHTHEVHPGEDDDKLIGVYSTRELAETAQQRALQLPGFRDAPDDLRFAMQELSRVL